MMSSKELLERYYDYIATPLVDEIIEIIKPYFDRLEQLEKENKELKASYESLKKDYWELDKVEEDILQKFFVQGQVIVLFKMKY